MIRTKLGGVVKSGVRPIARIYGAGGKVGGRKQRTEAYRVKWHARGPNSGNRLPGAKTGPPPGLEEVISYKGHKNNNIAIHPYPV
jgi:hypothetical protein